MSVSRPDDFTFETFFKSIEQSKNVEPVDLSLEDFDAVERQSLLVIKKNVQVQRRRGTTRNPIKALASRTDIANEYTEVITGVAEREKTRLNIEKCKWFTQFELYQSYVSYNPPKYFIKNSPFLQNKR